jgi:hypothetical protein
VTVCDDVLALSFEGSHVFDEDRDFKQQKYGTARKEKLWASPTNENIKTNQKTQRLLSAVGVERKNMAAQEK